MSQLVFLAIFAVGFVILLVSALLGDLGDADGDMDGDSGTTKVLSLKVVACFMIGFGMFASISNYWITADFKDQGMRNLVNLFVGLFGGLGVGGIGWWIISALLKQQATYKMETYDFIGVRTPLSLGIPEGGCGEVIFEMNGRKHSLSVRTTDGRALKTGIAVRITEMHGATALVEKAE